MAKQLGLGHETVRHWVVQADIDDGARGGVTSQGLAEIKKVKAGALLPLAAILLAPASTRVPVTVVAVLVALALTGVISSRIGGSRPLVAVRGVLVGAAAGLALTYAIGRFFGGAIG